MTMFFAVSQKNIWRKLKIKIHLFLGHQKFKIKTLMKYGCILFLNVVILVCDGCFY